MKNKLRKFLSISILFLLFNFLIGMSYSHNLSYKISLNEPSYILNKNYKKANSLEEDNSHNQSNINSIQKFYNNEALNKRKNQIKSTETETFKVYKKDEYFKFSNDNPFLDIVSAKISGLPKNIDNDIVLKELNFISLNDQKNDYNIPYIRNSYIKDGIKHKYEISSLEKSDDLINNNNVIENKINDSSFTSGIKIANVHSPMDVEFNILFNKPITINDIQVSMDLNIDPNFNWNKIGSIELMNKEGEVFRKDGIPLSSNLISSSFGDKFPKNTRIIFDSKRNIKKFPDSSNSENYVPSNIRSTLTDSEKINEYVIDTKIGKEFKIKILENFNPNNYPSNLFINYRKWIENEYDKENKEKKYTDYNFKEYFSKTDKLNILNSYSKYVKISNPLESMSSKEINTVLIGGVPVFLEFSWKKISNDNYTLLLQNKPNIINQPTNKNEGILYFSLFNTWFNNSDSINLSVNKMDLDWEFFSNDNKKKNAKNAQPLISIKYTVNADEAIFKEYNLFVGSSSEDKSIVPIFRTKNIDLEKYSTLDNKIISSKNISIELTKEEQYSLFLKISDSKMRESILEDLNLNNYIDIDFNNINNYLEEYNSKKKNDNNNETYYFPINISLSGDGNTIDTNSLDLYSYLGFFQNINELSFYYIGTNNFSYSYFLRDLDWVSDIINIKKVKFIKNIDSPNQLYLDGSLNELPNIIKNLHSIDELDLSSYINSVSLNNPLTNLSSSLRGRINDSLKIKLPINLLENLFNDSEKELDFKNSWNIKYLDIEDNDILETEKIDKSNFFQITSKNKVSIEPPKIMYANEKNEYIISQIYADGKIVSAKISAGILYWNWAGSRITNFKNLAWKKRNTNEYYSNYYVSKNNIDKKQLVEIEKPKYLNYQSSPYIIPNLKNIYNVNLDEMIKVDDKEHGIKIYKGKAFYNYQLKNIKFVNINEFGEASMFTSIDKIVQKYGLRKFKDLNLYSYNSEKNVEKGLFDALKDNYIKNPNNSIFSEIWINNIRIDELIIYEGDYYWKLPNVNINEIKYMTDNQHFYTDIKIKGKLIKGLTSLVINNFENYPSKHAYKILNGTKIKSLNDLKQEIIIDDKKINKILMKNYMYYKFDISKVKLVIINDEDPKKNRYYTDLTKLPKVYNKTKLFSLERYEKDEESSELNFVNIPVDEKNKLSIQIDSKTYFSTWQAGRWVWKIPENILNEISFVNNQNQYFTKIKESDLISNILSSVSTDNIDTTSDIKLPIFPYKLNKENLINLKNGYMFDGKKYDYIIRDSHVYISDEHYKRGDFIIIDTNNLVRLYSNIYKIPKMLIPKSWSYERPLLKPENEILLYRGDAIKSPDKVKEKFIRVSISGRIKYVIIEEIDGKKYYLNHNKIINSIKWIDKETNIYYTEYDKLPITSEKINSIDQNLLKTETFIKNKKETLAKQIKRNREIAIIISITLLSISISSILIYVLSRKIIIKKR